MTAPCLTTERILLRPYEKEDFTSFAALNGNPLVRQRVGTGETLSKAASRALFDTFTNPVPYSTQAWAAVLTKTSQYVGHLFLAPHSTDSRPELGFLFDPPVWGQGLATEAARRVVDYALHERGEEEILATVDCDHVAAIRVLEKIGMKLRRRPRDERGEYLVYSIHHAGPAIPSDSS